MTTGPLNGTLNGISSVNEDQIHSLNHYGPVTALKIHKNYILAGYGCIFKVFQFDQATSTTELIYSQQIFKRNKIHHVSVSRSGDRLAVSGGRSFAIFDFSGVFQPHFSPVEKAINEWIVCCEFKDEKTLLVLNSHNTVYTVDISNSPKLELVQKVHCNEKSILYSGSIRIIDNGKDDPKVLIAAGTVMNGVIIWDFNNRKIVHNLTEHEGSIFGVQIDESANHIISCSDDRSVKLYDFHTGTLLANGWGHGSRIWNLCFFNNIDDGLKIMSTGEDCTVRLWEYEPGNPLLVQQELLENAHLGKHVWSGAIDDKVLRLFVSGGADGKIRLHDLINRQDKPVKQFSLDLISGSGIVFSKKEIIKQYFELASLNILVMLTSLGKLILFDQKEETFREIQLDSAEKAKFVDFGVMRGFANINYVLIASRSGDILKLRFTSSSAEPIKSWITETNLVGNKVTNMLVDSDPENNNYFSLTDSPNPKVPFVLHKYKMVGEDLELVATHRLEQPQQTSFTTTDMKIDFVNNWLILGSRYVSIAVYDITKLNEKPIISLDALFKKLSQGDTITSISILRSVQGLVSLLLTVRDGVYLYVNISNTGNFEISIVHENKLSRGFIEGGFVDNNELILYGFKSSYFYIWNESRQIEIANELCGGAHRQWELFKYPGGFKFVYINKSSLHVKHFNNRFGEYGVINSGTHGREIRDVAISSSVRADNSRLIMTASEDTTVRLGKLDLNTGQISSYWSLNHHVSGLQRVKFIDEQYAGSSAANEEFIMWKISELENAPVIIEYARLKPGNSNPDLRIMDFDSFKYKKGLIISTVYSDSSIKVWYFDIEAKTFRPIISDHYTTCCILSVEFLFLNGRTLLQIGATDGHLSIWDITDKLENEGDLGKMIIKQQLHQNGIKAIQSLKFIDSYKIITGGDDNALISSNLSYKNGLLVLETTSFIEKAASATITSISKGVGNTIWVTSVDQIVRLWDTTDNELVCKSASYTTIADTGCSDSVNDILLVGGAGLSSWKQNH